MCLGIPGRVVEFTGKSQAAVDVGGVRRQVNMACVQAAIGDWVLVHVGFAMARIDEREAAQTLAILEELGDVQRR
jgi:hydrogenase expression/formation protein HypC